MFNYSDLDLHECNYVYVTHGLITPCDGDTKTAEEVAFE